MNREAWQATVQTGLQESDTLYFSPILTKYKI